MQLYYIYFFYIYSYLGTDYIADFIREKVVVVNASKYFVMLFFNSSQATKLMWRRRKSWLGWKHVVYQFTLWCSNSRWLNLSLYESKSWLWFKLWNASFLRLTKLTSVPSDFALIVNLGVYSDALMIMKQSRTRLVTISCATHRLELF